MTGSYDFSLSERSNNGIKHLRIRMPEALEATRRNILLQARRVCDGIPLQEVEASIIEASWRRHLERFRLTSKVGSRLVQVDVPMYLDTMYEVEDYMNGLMLSGVKGGVRALYAMLEEGRR